MNGMLAGREIVRHYDERGLPFDFAFDALEKLGEPVALLGILCECAARKWSRKMLKRVVAEWSRRNEPTPAEVLAISRIMTDMTD